jgi:hypothetical protein
MNRIAHLPISLVLFSSLTTIPARSAEPQPPPRYRLEVGQQLVYEGSSRFKYQNGSHGTTDKTTFWVARKNDDGSWHVIAHNENTFGQSHGESDEPPAPGPKQEAFDSFDLHPDGRVPLQSKCPFPERAPRYFPDRKST